MRAQGTAQQLEKRRRQAIRLLKAGQSLPAVAQALSASVSSVSRWFQTYREKGQLRAVILTFSAFNVYSCLGACFRGNRFSAKRGHLRLCNGVRQ